MGVISKRFSILAFQRVSTKLLEAFGGLLTEGGCSESEAAELCKKVVAIAHRQMNGKYTEMGGYPPDDQLFDKARQILSALDESGELAEMLDDLQAPEEKSCAAEPDLEDAYNAADSIRFIGSEKQISWARSIAANSSYSIAESKLTFAQLPTSAKWWIENRDDVHSALKKLK